MEQSTPTSASAIPSESLSALSVQDEKASPSNSNASKPVRKRQPGKAKAQQRDEDSSGTTNPRSAQVQKPKPQSGTKLRGLDRDSPEVRVSKTLSWLLRHGAQGEGLKMRQDGYVKVVDLLEHPKLKAQGLDLERIKEIVRVDSKQRYDLILEDADGAKLPVDLEAKVPAVAAAQGASSSTASSSLLSGLGGTWLIKARQGHSMKEVQLDLKPITSVSEVPTGVAVHGTNSQAWKAISTQGLSKMKRNHIHLAQGVAGKNVISGMRTSSQILIFINMKKALDGGIKFFLSDNGVILTEGDKDGFLKPEYFERVENSKREAIEGWEGMGLVQPQSTTQV
ncbi:KptA family-domain-containing protein [Crassisporium funariophilum]|nr:KptA family-domain-containing protein [Crassisporium funariophilum]